MTAAGFNRRIRKTVRTVVWEGDRAQSRSLDLIIRSQSGLEQHTLAILDSCRKLRSFLKAVLSNLSPGSSLTASMDCRNRCWTLR